jgi:hypothetical protein
VDYLMKLIRKGDDVSLATLEKIRESPWKARPPNVRETLRRCEERDDPWENIPQEDCTSEMSKETSPPQVDIPQEDPHASPQTQLLRRQGDLPNWQDLIGSRLEELKMTHPDQYEGAGPIPQDSENPTRPGTANTEETFKVMHTLHYDPEVRQATNAFFEALSRSGHDILATEGRKIIRNIVAGVATTGDNNVRKKITVTTQNLGPSGIFRAMQCMQSQIHWPWDPSSLASKIS